MSVKSIEFVVPGDPVSCLRITQGQLKLLRIPRAKLWAGQLRVYDRIHKYLAYKEEIQYRCPIKVLDNAFCLDIIMYFRNQKHPDPDNVFKAFADALFTNDNRLVGSFRFHIDPTCPRVEVKISLDEGGKT